MTILRSLVMAHGGAAISGTSQAKGQSTHTSGTIMCSFQLSPEFPALCYLAPALSVPGAFAPRESLCP